MNNILWLHIKFWEYSFHSPQWLWLLILVPLLLLLRFLILEKSGGTVKFSRSVTELSSLSFRPMKWVIFLVYAFIGIGGSLLIFAMAKPYLPLVDNSEKEFGEGIDIMIAMDVSGSMLATDFLPNRLEAAKQMAKEFIDGRESDYIGFIVFEGEAYTACPATRDYDFLKGVIDRTQTGLMTPGTAIGTGLGTAVARLRTDSLASKVIILLTDGENNSGDITPMSAAQLAKNKNIKVYTIGVGKKGYAEVPISTPFGTIKQRSPVSIDEQLLEKMATLTGGKYFRATDENSLRSIYKKIDEMETRKTVDKTIKREPPIHPKDFLVYGMLFLIIGVVTEQVLLKKHA